MFTVIHRLSFLSTTFFPINRSQTVSPPQTVNNTFSPVDWQKRMKSFSLWLFGFISPLHRFPSEIRDEIIHRNHNFSHPHSFHSTSPLEEFLFSSSRRIPSKITSNYGMSDMELFSEFTRMMMIKH